MRRNLRKIGPLTENEPSQCQVKEKSKKRVIHNNYVRYPKRSFTHNGEELRKMGFDYAKAQTALVGCKTRFTPV